MYFVFFFFFCSPHRLFACNQSSLKCDWLIPFGLQMQTRVLPVPKSCPITYRFCTQISVYRNDVQFYVGNLLSLTLLHESCCRFMQAGHLSFFFFNTGSATSLDTIDSHVREATVSAVVTTSFTLAERKRLSKQRTKECHKAVIGYLVKGLNPLSTVESPWFRYRFLLLFIFGCTNVIIYIL